MPQVHRFVDRGSVLEGINRTLRDSRVPHNVPRSAENFTMPDGRIRRRPGFSKHSGRPIHGNQLAKATGNYKQNTRSPNFTYLSNKPEFFTSPLSYASLRWHDDFQPKVARNWTVEFLFTLGELEELVRNPFDRISEHTYGLGASRVSLRNAEGVYLYDQCVLSNYLTFNYDSANNNVLPSGTDVDTFGLNALSILYTENEVIVTSTLVESNVYYMDDVYLTAPLNSYAVGDTYHVAVTYTAVDRTMRLFLNGVEEDNVIIGGARLFVGEADAINGLTTAIQRDIVLLNECTARGSYSSTCKVVKNVGTVESEHGHQAFAHYYVDSAAADGAPAPWACSPPRGTGMSELRIWHTNRSSEELKQYMLERMDPTGLTDLKGYWRLNDGGPVCFDSTSNGRNITVHHNYPGYVGDDSLLHSRGLVIADGQHLRAEFGATDYAFVQDVHRPLTDVFTPGGNNSAATDQLNENGDFTVQMQIRTPYSWQQEINKKTGAASYTPTNGSARDMMEVGEFSLFDGHEDGLTELVRRDTNAVPATRADTLYHRAYDMTLWSVEAQRQVKAATTASEYYEGTRVPLARGLIQPDGKVAFEFFGWVNNSGGTQHNAVELRCESATALSLDTVHTITFVKETVYEITAGNINANGIRLSIYLDGNLTADATLDVLDVGGDVTLADITSWCQPHGGVREVLIGASYVNDLSDLSIRVPAADTITFNPHRTTQRFMSPYQDQPGFFTLGYFRMWSTALDAGGLTRTVNRSIKHDPRRDSLLFNLELESINGDTVVNHSAYSVNFKMGYKSWGQPEPGKQATVAGHPIGGMFCSDCLGYQPQTDEFNNIAEEADVNGMSAYTSTLGQTYGLLAVFDDAIYYDAEVGGSFDHQPISARGLLNDFLTGQRWRGTTIGDRTILTSRGGTPKSFNGRIATQAGFRQWDGGFMDIVETSVGGSLSSGFYAVRVSYVSENNAINQLSPVQVVYVSTGDALRIDNLGPHPDPRIGSIHLAISGVQADYATALTAKTFLVPNGVLPNKFITRVLITEAPSTTELDDTVTPMPVCEFSTAANNRLYLSGDQLVPDVVYFTDAGNPERIDTLSNRIVLEEGSGDAVNNLFTLYGSVFAFKKNGIWKIEEVSVGTHQVQGVAPLGPTNSDAVAIITIPETGTITFVMWTYHGPYLYDGINLRYIGYALEGSDPYAWVDHDSVFILHDAESRELLFCYKSKDAAGNVVDRHDRAVVYNYRNSAWVGEYTGIIGNFGYSLSFTKSGDSFTPVAVGTSGKLEGARSTIYRAFLGGSNGLIFQWNSGDEDAPPNAQKKSYRVQAWASPVMQLSITELSDDDPAATIQDGELRGYWLTVVKADTTEHFTYPILDNYDEDNVVLDLNYGTIPFTPEPDDTVYIGRPPATIEFPWDILEIPYYDKHATRLTTWHKEQFFFKVALNWNENEGTRWDRLVDTAGRRKHTSINHACEALKLYLKSFELKSELDAYGYLIRYNSEATVKQL